MFCQACGTAVAEAAAACSSCSAPVARSIAGGPSTIARTLDGTSKEALAAFKIVAGNPVGGLAAAHESLGEAKSMRVGVAFGVVSMACFLLGGYLLLPPFMKEDLFELLGFGGVMKCLLFGVVPFACVAIGSAAVRKALGGRGSLAGDCFVAGAALLPISTCMLASGILGIGNFEAIGALAVLAGCTAILMLFAGYTRISALTERAATIAVPVVVMLSAWLAKVIATSVLGGGGSGGGSYEFPY